MVSIETPLRFTIVETDLALNDTVVRAVQHSGVPAGDKYSDDLALYLLVKSAGKNWRMNYRFAGKQNTLALGVYPAESLAKGP